MWDVTQQEPRQVKLIDGVIPAVKDKEYVCYLEPRFLAVSDIWCSSRDFAYDCSAVWHPSGQYFVVASRTHGTPPFSDDPLCSDWSSDIVTIARDSWTKTSTFNSSSSTGNIYAVALSPNGVYLASSTNKDINIWSTQTRRLLFS